MRRSRLLGTDSRKGWAFGYSRIDAEQTDPDLVLHDVECFGILAAAAVGDDPEPVLALPFLTSIAR